MGLFYITVHLREGSLSESQGHVTPVILSKKAEPMHTL